MPLRCHYCNYKFTPKTGKIPKVCPFCSRPGGMKKEATAADIVREVEDMP